MIHFASFLLPHLNSFGLNPNLCMEFLHGMPSWILVLSSSIDRHVDFPVDFPVDLLVEFSVDFSVDFLVDFPVDCSRPQGGFLRRFSRGFFCVLL